MQSDIVELIKDSVEIGELSKRLGLQLKKKAGRSLQGDCPTGHDSQSHQCFSVSPEQGLFHCFNCGIAGDAIELVKLVERVDFQGALRYLAENYRPDLVEALETARSERSPETKARYERSALYEHLVEHGKKLLFETEGREALEYLVKERGYKPKHIRATDWFYLPPDRDARDYLRSLHERSNVEIDLPLKGAYWGHMPLALPWRDRRGIITGIVRRSILPDGDYDERNEKHVRYDYTSGLDKSDLFGLHRCGKEAKTVMIVEGLPDAAILPAMGLPNVVAVGQGALSEKHLTGLKYSGVERVIIAFDKDHAGPDNTRKALETLKGSGIRAFVLDPDRLDDAKDPDEYAKKHGLEALKKLKDQAISGTTYMAQRFVSLCNASTPLERDEAMSEAVEYMVGIEDIGDQRIFQKELTEYTDISADVLEARIKTYVAQQAEKRLSKGYERLLRDAGNLQREGNFTSLRDHLTDGLKELSAAAVTSPLKPYGQDAFMTDIKKTEAGLKTGISGLDEKILIPRKAVTIIAGRPSHGKTALLANMFLNMVEADKDKAFVFFSYEQAKMHLNLRLLNIMAGVVVNPNDAARNLYHLEHYLRSDGRYPQGMGKGDRDRIQNACERLNGYASSNRLYLIDDHLPVETLIDHLAQLQERREIGCVFIDYIQKIKTRGRYGTRQTEIQAISERILETAIQLSIPVVLAAQLGRIDKSKGYTMENVVRVDNLREAGDIEQDANLVVGLWNETKGNEEAEKDNGMSIPGAISTYRVESDITIKVLKNRDGISGGKVPLSFHGPTGMIGDKSQKESPW